METVKEITEKITGVNQQFIDKAQERLDNLTKPQGSLGRLEELAKLIAGITEKITPIIKNKVIFTFAADHGITEEGVSAYPKEVTAQMVYNFLGGGAGINVLAKHIGAKVVVADLGVAEDLKPHPNLIIKKISYGTKNITKAAAMTKKEAVNSIEAGIEIFLKEFESGIDIAGTGDMGIGNTAASSAIAACFTKKSVEDITDKGTGIDDARLQNKIKAIKQALNVNQPNPDDAIDVLSKVGGFEIGGLSGIMLAAASKKVPIVIDGFISGAAALIAYKLQPKLKQYIIASHCSVEKGHKLILDYLGLKPLLNLNLRLGEGTGAALAINLVEAATKILTQMATFQDAGVSKNAM